MKPMMIVPPGCMSKEDIEQLRQNDICVVEAKEPALVKFVDPIPVQSSRTQIEDAAIQLSRRLLRGEGFDNFGQIKFSGVNKLFVECLVKGTPLEEGPTQAEREAKLYTFEKAEEIKRLAREEARAERSEAKRKKKAADAATEKK